MGILIETRGLFERGDLFNLAKTMVSMVPRLEHKMEKLKYKKLKVVQPRIKNNAKQLMNLLHGLKERGVSSFFP